MNDIEGTPMNPNRTPRRDHLVGIRARKATARPPWTVKRERRAANRRARKSRKANR